jgi:four helix bundle protein
MSYRAGMRATCLEDLQVHTQAVEAATAVAAILERGCFRRDKKLHEQIADASAKIAPNIAEGFGQGTDKHCAHFQYIARGSCNEIRSHLGTALIRRYLTQEEHDALCERFVVIGKRLTRWIQHLNRENRKQRG